MSIDASIFIRSYNEAEFIGECITRIHEQNSSAKIEIIVLDSESVDDTAVIAKRLGATVYSIPKTLFSYSGALNAGASICKGEFFIPLSAHAVPCDTHWLASLLEAFDHPSVGASYSKQLSWPEASPPEKRALNKEFSAQARVVKLDHITRQVSQVEDIHALLQFSNASSCIRRSLLSEIPFRDLPFSEDRAFAFDCLRAGYKIAYTPRSQVFHSHYPLLDEFYKVGRQATFAEYAIQELAKREWPELPDKQPPAFWKLLAIIPFACMRAMPALMRSIVSTPGNRSKDIREAGFHLSSIGTTFGKWQGYKDYRREGEDRSFAPKSASNLLEEIHAQQQSS